MQRTSRYQIIGDSNVSTVLKLCPNELIQILSKFCNQDFITKNLNYILIENQFGEKQAKKTKFNLFNEATTIKKNEVKRIVDKYVRKDQSTEREILTKDRKFNPI